MPVVVVAQRFEEPVVDLFGLRLGFLYADDVEAVLLYPFAQAFGEGRTDAVEVVGDDVEGHGGVLNAKIGM